MMKTTCLALFVLAATFSTWAGTEQRVEDLVKVTLKGTEIDQLPRYIHVIVSDPKAAARETASHIGPKKENLASIFLMRSGQAFMYYRPKDWRYEGIELVPEIGDVIYIFHFADAASMEAFLKKYHLNKVQKVVDGKRYLYLCRASDHFYVVTEIVGTSYTCAMHPKIRKSKPGRCPICAMALVEDRP